MGPASASSHAGCSSSTDAKAKLSMTDARNMRWETTKEIEMGCTEGGIKGDASEREMKNV